MHRGTVFAWLLAMCGNVLACTCSDANPDYLLEQAHTVIVAVPIEAMVKEAPSESYRGTVHAKLQVLDVLKGTMPENLPLMLAAVEPQSSACQIPINLGAAYVVYLMEEGQSEVYVSVCGPHREFRPMRLYLEGFCIADREQFGECFPLMRDLLRNAGKANARYGLSEQWLIRYLKHEAKKKLTY